MLKRALVGAALATTAIVLHTPPSAVADPPGSVGPFTMIGTDEVGIPLLEDPNSTVYRFVSVNPPPEHLDELLFSSTTANGIGLYYDEVSDKLYLIINEGMNFWIIEL